MLVYIIDAFNLLHKIKSLKNSGTPHSDLINYIRINNLTGSKNNRVIIVFDGNVVPQIQGQERFYKVIFGIDRSADALIKLQIEKFSNRSQVIVVSDDREIRDFVKASGGKPMHVCDFIKPKHKQNTNNAGTHNQKDISYSLQREITEEMRQIWLKDSTKD